MSKDINLTSKKWNDIVFEGRPKDYGAYEIRLSSSRRHVAAFICIVALMVVVALLPRLIETVASFRTVAENISEDTTLADLKILEDEVQQQDEIVQQAAAPLPPLRSTIQFVAPVIVDDEEINEDELIKTQDELQKSTAQISLFNVEGTDEELGVDLAELEEHQIIAGENVENKVFDFVQQKPQFPGGDKALLEYIYSHVEYPQMAIDNGIQGTVTVRFVVRSDGSIDDVTIMRSPDPILDKPSTDVIKRLPKWIPGSNNGVPVNVYFYTNIIFEIH
jgi:protein TonB